MSEELEKKIANQVEYYFGDINLPRDKFLQEKIKEDDGWVSLEVLLSFNRLSKLSKDEKVIADAVEKSERKLVVVSEDRKKLRRSPDFPLPEFNDDRKKELTSRTAYAKGFPLQESLDDIVTFLEKHGPIESCQRRTYHDKIAKEHKFKGSCFIIFKDVETCKKFVEAESIKYKDTELIRKMQADYHEAKKNEILERRKDKKKDKKEDEKPAREIKYPPGTIVHFSGVKPEQTLNREQIKEKVAEITKSEVSFIDYSKGLAEGYLRFQDENGGVEFHGKLEDGKLKIEDVELTFRTLTDEEVAEYLKKVATMMQEKKKMFKKGGKFNRKRKGAFTDHGPKSKISKK